MTRRLTSWRTCLCVLFFCSASFSACAPSQAPQSPPPPIVRLNDAQASALSGVLHAHYDAQLDAPRPHLPPPLDDVVADKASVLTLTDVYALSGARPLWISQNDDVLSEPGQALWAMLNEATTHEGIAPHTLGALRLKDAIAQAKAPKRPEFTITAEDRELIDKWLRKQGISPDSPASFVPRLLEEGVLTRQDALAQRYLDARTRMDHTRAKLDVAMSASLIEWARTVRLNNDAWLRHTKWPESLQTKDKTPSAALQAERRVWAARATIKPVIMARTKDATRQALMGIRPHFEQYTRLMQAHVEYAERLQKGGWPRLNEALVGLKKGATHPGFAVLRQRLHAEGLFEGDLTSHVLDEELTQGILTYQHTHQMWQKGVVTKEMWRSANVPVQRRLMEIRVALDAWRATPVGSDPYYIRANIPDFHVEVWDKAKRLTRMRVVAGSNRREYNRSRRRWENPQRTVTFSDSMQYIVFRPYWNIPKGITQNEIMPEVEKDPEYLAKNRYEWVETSPTNKYLRQLPGKSNALGQVKFLFPNKHDIYMHDTPHKSKFAHPVRAYSHGCVRLKEPMTMAKVLLEHEGRWKPNLVKQYLARDSETWMTLKEQVPVHIDYVVVRVDAKGRTHFLADIYTQARDEVTAHTAQAIAQRMRATSRGLSATLDAETEEIASR